MRQGYSAKRDARKARAQGSKLRKARAEAFEKTFDILPLDGGTLPDLVEVMMDLTHSITAA